MTHGATRRNHQHRSCDNCTHLREEISALTQEMREMQREHDHHYRELENELRMAEQSKKPPATTERQGVPLTSVTTCVPSVHAPPVLPTRFVAELVSCAMFVKWNAPPAVVVSV